MTPLLSPLTRRVPSGFHAVDNTKPLHISNEKNQRKREHESSYTSTVSKQNGCASPTISSPPQATRPSQCRYRCNGHGIMSNLGDRALVVAGARYTCNGTAHNREERKGSLMATKCFLTLAVGQTHTLRCDHLKPRPPRCPSPVESDCPDTITAIVQKVSYMCNGHQRPIGVDRSPRRPYAVAHALPGHRD